MISVRCRNVSSVAPETLTEWGCALFHAAPVAANSRLHVISGARIIGEWHTLARSLRYATSWIRPAPAIWSEQ